MARHEPPSETIKVWRTALVILGMHNDKVLDPDLKFAWREIKEILHEQDKPTNDKVSSTARDFDPVDPKTLEDRVTEARFSLAAGLAKTIKDGVLGQFIEKSAHY